MELRRKRFAEATGVYRRALDRARKANDAGHQIASLWQLASALRDQQPLDEALVQVRAELDLARQVGAVALEAQALLVVADIQRLRRQSAEALGFYEVGEAVVGTSGDVELLWRLAVGKGQLLEDLNRTEEALAAYQRAAATPLFHDQNRSQCPLGFARLGLAPGSPPPVSLLLVANTFVLRRNTQSP